MDRETYLAKKPFELPQAEKEAFYEREMKILTRHHRKACRTYDDICSGLGQDGPYLPVAIFKDLELRSVPEDEVIRQVTSSGTTGQNVSRIFLDAETSAGQQRALCMITGDFIGSRRMPMLIIDSPDVLRDRKKFSARGAGILGFSMMASKRYYALDRDMRPDWDSIEAFQKEAESGPSFAFGFTYMIWEYFYKAARDTGRNLDLGECYLIHGGGWKKLQSSSVSDAEFRKGLREVFGIKKVSDYYGMAEQTGSIFMQCPEGHLHASIYSDVSILRPEDFTPCSEGEWGLVALESLLPGSYPGHKLLTEDWGRILGTDDCPCGRRGRYFEVRGRIAKAEIRGCSDTFAVDDTAKGRSNGTEAAAMDEEDSSVSLMAGVYPSEQRSRDVFAPQVKAFLEKLSALFTREVSYRRYPEVYALGFWCRHAHIDKLEKRHGKKGKGRGLVLHIAPSNMPVMFAYSWITSLLAGNSNVVRLSQRRGDVSETVLEGIRQILDMPEFAELKRTNAFVSFPREHGALEYISQQAAARMVWGGDETVHRICGIPKAAGCIDLTFPDKYSIALLDTDEIGEVDDAELRHLAHLFYNDTYGADQNACSSPKTIFWIKSRIGKDMEKIRSRWWDAVAEEAKNYDLQPWMATEKYRMLCRMYARSRSLGTVKKWGNRLYVVPWKKADTGLAYMEAAMGIFYECEMDGVEDIIPLLGRKIQTIVSSGNRQEQLYRQLREAGCPGVDRVVRIGEALDFDTVWDRKDLIDMLSVKE